MEKFVKFSILKSLVLYDNFFDFQNDPTLSLKILEIPNETPENKFKPIQKSDKLNENRKRPRIDQDSKNNKNDLKIGNFNYLTADRNPN